MIWMFQGRCIPDLRDLRSPCCWVGAVYPAWSRTLFLGGMFLHYTDPAQPITTTGWDLYDLCDLPVDDLSDVRTNPFGLQMENMSKMK